MTQYLIEEALLERLDHVDREVKRRMGDFSTESTDLSGMSPGEQQKASHQARMGELRGG